MKEIIMDSMLRAEQNTHDFIRDVKQINNILPFLTDYEIEAEEVSWAVNRFVAFEGGSGNLYLPKHFTQSFREVSEGGLSFSPLSSSSHRKSSHGVFFGDLHAGRGKLRLAVKPHQDGDTWTPAVREQIVTDAFRQIGFHTLMPMGVALFDDEEHGKRAYGLTMLYDDLTTFDSLDWSRFYENPSKNPAMRSMWRSLAAVYARMHDRGTLSHNDAWGRNAATSLFYAGFEIDEEHATIAGSAPRDAEVRFGRSFGDIMSIGKSICYPLVVPYDKEQGLGIVTDHFNSSWGQVYRDVFFDSYILDRKKLAHKKKNKTEKMDTLDEIGQLDVDVVGHFARLQERHNDYQ